jgi:tetratricopeptide (TPR) repeat protein
MTFFALATLLAAASPISSAPLPAPAPAPSETESRFAACVALSDKNPAKAVEEATKWQVIGGGVPARQCLGIAFATQALWPSAMTAFVQAAEQAERDRDGRAARLWVQAGNAALASGDAAKARGFLDIAIIGGQLKGPEAGEALLDRARTFNALKQTAAARADIDGALKLVPADPLAWLLSATLARRMGDLPRAVTDMSEAARLAPDDANVALEAGNIAVMQGNGAAAKTAWTAAAKLAPSSVAGKAALVALKQFEADTTP